MVRGIKIVVALLALGGPCLAAQPLSPWLWSPYLGDVGTDFAAISWKTARPVTVDLRYARASAGDAAERWDEILTFEQQEGIGEIWLRGLVPESTYRYQVTAYEGVVAYPTRLGTFRTSAEDLSAFTFLSYGETRLLSDRHRLVADAMAENETGAAFVVHVGGLVDAPDEAQYTNLLWAIAPLSASCPYLPVHDDPRLVGDAYYDTFALPIGGGDAAEQWWSFDYGCVHVVALDSALVGPEAHAAMTDQVEWLARDLARPGVAGRFIVVFASSPLYGSDLDGSAQTLREAWEELFREYGVDVVVSGGAGGYEHLYRNGIHYVITAGGGGPLEPEPGPSVVGSVARRPTALHYLRITAADGSLCVEAIPVAWVEGDEVFPTPGQGPIDTFTLRGK